MKPGHIVALVVLVLSMAVTLISFSGAITQHVTIAQAKARVGETVQVPGKIIHETAGFDASVGGLRFDVTDLKNPAERMTIIYKQPKPENFNTAVSVEAVGEYSKGVFHASTLLVKCPSKYSDKK